MLEVVKLAFPQLPYDFPSCSQGAATLEDTARSLEHKLGAEAVAVGLLQGLEIDRASFCSAVTSSARAG